MHPREAPKQAQSRRKAQPGWWPGEHLQRRVGLLWGLTLGAGVHWMASHALSRRKLQGKSFAPTPGPDPRMGHDHECRSPLNALPTPRARSC